MKTRTPWLVPLVVALWLYPLSWSRADDHEAVDTNLLTAHFSRLVFGPSPAGRSLATIRKWTGPMSVVLMGTEIERWRPVVEMEARLLSRLTGLERDAEAQDGAAVNLIVHFTERKTLPTVAGDYALNPDFARRVVENANCASKVVENDGRIRGGVAIVSVDIPYRHTVSCILEELVHILGFPYHSEIVRPSILGTKERPMFLSATDQILIRALYDPRLRPGMARAEALPIARAIIGEMVAEASGANDN